MVKVGQTVKQFVNFSQDKSEGRPTDKELLYGKVIYLPSNLRCGTERSSVRPSGRENDGENLFREAGRDDAEIFADRV